MRTEAEIPTRMCVATSWIRARNRSFATRPSTRTSTSRSQHVRCRGCRRHAREDREPRFASHTITLGMDVLLNGKPITESEIVGLFVGAGWCPAHFVSGDDRLQNDLKIMPWIEFVVTKKATSASTVESAVDSVHAEMRDKAAKAVRNLAKAKVMKVAAPMQAGLHAVPPATLESLKGVPGINYANETVTSTAPDFRAAYDGVLALVRVARSGYPQVLAEQVRKLPDGKKVMADYSDALFMRWMDYESGRWKPSATTASTGRIFMATVRSPHRILRSRDDVRAALLRAGPHRVPTIRAAGALDIDRDGRVDRGRRERAEIVMVFDSLVPPITFGIVTNVPFR